MTDTTTTGAAPAAAALPTTNSISLPDRLAAVKATISSPGNFPSLFSWLLIELEDVPGEVTSDLAKAKEHVLAAISWVETHFTTAKAAAETEADHIKIVANTDAAAIETDATDVQAAVEKAV